MPHNLFKKTEMFISLDVVIKKVIVFKIYTNVVIFPFYYLEIIQKSISLQ